MELTRNTAVNIYVYDLAKTKDTSRGMRTLASSLKSITFSEDIPHISIVVFGNEYAYGMDGVSSKEPGRDFKKSILHGYTTKTRIDLEFFIDNLKSKGYMSQNYNVRTHNCICFANELSKFLLGIPVPDRFLNAPSELITKAAIIGGAAFATVGVLAYTISKMIERNRTEEDDYSDED